MKQQITKCSLVSYIKEFNAWCEMFKVGTMVKFREEKRMYYPGEFDTEKFKKMVASKKELVK
jgi:hypothetical protein